VGDTFEFRPPDANDRAWLKALVERANAGDLDAVAGVRDFLDRNPQIWRSVGDMAAHAEAAWVELIGRGDRLLGEALTREADRLRGELLGDHPTPVERMLVDQVVVSHLELRYLQVRAAEAPGTTSGQIASATRRLDGAQRRYLAALKSLETVRRLSVRDDGRARLQVFRAEGTG
jgi:hypothetical protein